MQGAPADAREIGKLFDGICVHGHDLNDCNDKL
jgi:hypothetical protein